MLRSIGAKFGLLKYRPCIDVAAWSVLSDVAGVSLEIRVAGASRVALGQSMLNGDRDLLDPSEARFTGIAIIIEDKPTNLAA